MNIRDFSELLKGCRAVKDKDGNIVVQSILNMSIVCLTTDDEYSLDDRFANPLTAIKAHNTRYGQIGFVNTQNKEVIIPTQMAVMTKQVAQNHGMTKAGYVPKNGEVIYNDAGCVQGSQTGHFRNTNEYRFLPYGMREMAFETVGQPSSHSRIYDAINNLGAQTSTRTDSYLDKYFTKYDKKLEQFIAHFERPNKLIGMIVLVDGEIIAVDKFPSFTYAEQVWEMMIRDVYGSVAIVSELKNKSSKKEFTTTYETLKSKHRGDVISLLEKALNKTKGNMTANVTEKIEELFDITFDAVLDTEGHSRSTSAPKSYILKADGYVGQVLVESDFNHLVSIVKKESFDPTAYRKVSELKRKARSQQRFRL
ncbi:MAG: ARPP-1 family domain-containing protein [bacterium]